MKSDDRPATGSVVREARRLEPERRSRLSPAQRQGCERAAGHPSGRHGVVVGQETAEPEPPRGAPAGSSTVTLLAAMADNSLDAVRMALRPMTNATLASLVAEMARVPRSAAAALSRDGLVEVVTNLTARAAVHRLLGELMEEGGDG